jgi:predicted Fe-S protein YdhL (DUF1289 family)
MFFSPAPKKPVLSPCVGVCELNAAGYCVGCHRNCDEIARWLQLSDAQRLHLMNDVLPRRAAAQEESA